MLKRHIKLIAAGAASVILISCSQPGDDGVHGLKVVERHPDSAIGHDLFVRKGCVICHSVNGVGGKAAPALDAEIGSEPIDPLEFAARMWWGAPAMIELQSVELGYTIHLTADDITHLAAFAGDAVEQKKLSIDQVPEAMRDALLDERFWEVEDWSEFLSEGQENFPESEPEDETSDPDEPD